MQIFRLYVYLHSQQSILFMAKKPDASASQTSGRTGTLSQGESLKVRHEGPRFTRLNYILMGIGAVLLILGYIFIGGGEQRGNHFDPAEVYHPMRITIAPILILLGFLVEVVAIFYKSRLKDSQEQA